MGQRYWLPNSSLAGIKCVCRIKVYCIGFEERKKWMGKQSKKQKVEETEINRVGNQLYYTFVLKFALRLFPVTKRKRK